MELVALVEPSSEGYPGHMVIGQEIETEGPQHLGYRFDPDDLPDDYLPPERWRSYLFDHTVPGNIVDESEYIQLLLATLGRLYCTRRASCFVRIDTVLPLHDRWRQFAAYSFNPDDFHSTASPCYNCVTWAIEVGNQVLEGFLTPVRQGRIKLIAEQLQHARSPGVDDGGQADRKTGN